MTLSSPLDSAELERLSDQLSSERMPEAMPLDALQGLLYAIASGPQPAVTEDQWMPRAVGVAPTWTDDAERESTFLLLRRFAADCARDLMQAEDSLPIILFDEDNAPDYATWCQGYLDGVEADGERWYPEGRADAVDELLFPLRMLAGEVPPEERAEIADRDWRALEREARDNLVGVLLDIWHYWFDRRIARDPVRRETPKIGRNDPCHCGSGRKYKQCHGRSG
jgi:uncharacterized protein